MAWDVLRRTFLWEKVQPYLEETAFDEKPARRNTVPSAPEINLEATPSRARNRMITRKCTNLSHLLTLRSQGTKMGCRLAAPSVENVHGKVVGRSAARHQKSDAEHHIFVNIIWHLLISDFL
ncbi:unnamed protein product [Coffea canephora]|uniref:DH200=94 genomic scaffold, scaffold_8587 n=1 Tax=Coffea canephora TaxID=49390 RepID=A0A068VMZ1_COFCA|nr:unnamed protein product [Coffea canephora]